MKCCVAIPRKMLSYWKKVYVNIKFLQTSNTFYIINTTSLFVVHKKATVLVYKIACCLPRIYLMYNPIWTGISEEGIKITIARKCLSKSYGLCKKKAIHNWPNSILLSIKPDANKLLTNAIGRALYTFFRSSSAKPEVQLTDFFA